MSATTPKLPPTGDQTIRPEDMYMLDPQGVTYKKANPSYVHEYDGDTLVQDGEEMMLHVLQNCGDGPGAAQAYFEAFLKTPQAKLMPQRVKADLTALGLLG
jgi:hypothetical protein